ncbi:hypothetical protein ISCGN_021559 [Ixodes scapularis]
MQTQKATSSDSHPTSGEAHLNPNANMGLLEGNRLGLAWVGLAVVPWVSLTTHIELWERSLKGRGRGRNQLVLTNKSLPPTYDFLFNVWLGGREGHGMLAPFSCVDECRLFAVGDVEGPSERTLKYVAIGPD